MNAIRVLGFCGCVSAALSTVGGLGGSTALIGLGSLVMLLGNVFALCAKDPSP